MTIITRGRKRNGTTTLPSILRKKLVGKLLLRESVQITNTSDRTKLHCASRQSKLRRERESGQNK